jgi:dimethylamine--corrinoid protein Co-methyltransferase
MFERLLGADTIELSHNDYSFKAVKPVISDERTVVEQAVLTTTVPLYGAMPNLGSTISRKAPFLILSKLMSEGKIKKPGNPWKPPSNSRSGIWSTSPASFGESGVDGIDFDTTGSAGDADFLATPRAVEILKKNTGSLDRDGHVQEFVLGMHGGVSTTGPGWRGCIPHQQVKLAEKAGGDDLRPRGRTPTRAEPAPERGLGHHFPEGLRRGIDDPCTRQHGHGAAASGDSFVPIDAVSRASKSAVELTRLDGL